MYRGGQEIPAGVCASLSPLSYPPGRYRRPAPVKLARTYDIRWPLARAFPSGQGKVSFPVWVFRCFPRGVPGVILGGHELPTAH
jgi:hypothetical protein